MNENSINATYQGGSLVCADGNYYVGDPIENTNYTLQNFYWELWYPRSYPVYIQPEKSKVETAFKIVSKLMEKKLVNIEKVKTFIDLVTEISQIL
jgi:hypothetical protein